MKNNKIVIAILPLIINVSLHATLITIKSEAQFDTDVLNNPKPVVAKFAGSWCSVCSEVAEPFAQIADEPAYKDIVFAHIDLGELPAMTDKYDIVAIPTFIFFKNGQKKLQEVGVKDMNKFKETLRSNIEKAFSNDQENNSSDASLKRAENKQSFFETVVASLKSAYDSMCGTVSSMWNRLVS